MRSSAVLGKEVREWRAEWEKESEGEAKRQTESVSVSESDRLYEDHESSSGYW